jgi:hypothetical protein
MSQPYDYSSYAPVAQKGTETAHYIVLAIIAALAYFLILTPLLFGSSRQEGRTDRTSERQGGRTDRTSSRQGGRTDRTTARQDRRENKDDNNLTLDLERTDANNDLDAASRACCEPRMVLFIRVGWKDCDADCMSAFVSG